jgi:uncharacterized protein (TIGR00645 family)
MIKRLEALIAGVLVASRWLMAPLYIGLIAALIVVGVEFFRELIHTIAGFAGLDTDGVILAVLKLIDLVLIANLVLIMISAGIGTLGAMASEVEHAGWVEFVGKVDFSGLKLKVVASLIAIAAVDLLESFVGIDTAVKSDVLWQIAILMAFVVSGVLLAWMDRLVAEPHE